MAPGGPFRCHGCRPDGRPARPHHKRVQLTPDGHRAYLEAVEGAFGFDVDYAMLVKLCGKGDGTDRSAEARYSPPACIGTRTEIIQGDRTPIL